MNSNQAWFPLSWLCPNFSPRLTKKSSGPRSLLIYCHHALKHLCSSRLLSSDSVINHEQTKPAALALVIKHNVSLIDNISLPLETDRDTI